MQKLFVVSLCFAASVALPYDVIQDKQGQDYYLVPTFRARRGTTDWKMEHPGKFEFKHEQNLLNNDNHRLDGTAYGSKNIVDHKDPATVGGKLDYTYKGDSGVSVQAEHRRHQGTDLGIEGKYNVYRNGPLRVDVTGGYERHYGGPQGTQHPSYNTMLRGTYEFH